MSSAILLGKDKFTNTDRHMFEGLRILVIDKLLFLKDVELVTMMKHLKKLEDSHLPFAEYNIVFGRGGNSSK